MKKFLLLFLISLFTFSSHAQHRDESQMLFKPGHQAHVKSHASHVAAKDSATLAADSIRISPEAIRTSEAAEDFVAENMEETLSESDRYLQAGISMLQRGDYIAALKNFGEASRRGNHEAQYRIGLMYRDGTGVEKKAEEAAYWFRKAASNGHAEAQYQIGLCFEEGRGVLQDSRVAAEWMWRAAEQGQPEAAYKVGRMYAIGNIMDKNPRKAAGYMKIAADAGIPGARENLEEIQWQLPKIEPQKKQSQPRKGKKKTPGKKKGRK